MMPPSEESVKQCCTAFYGSDVAHLLLGESFHPGGLRLTERLGKMMQLKPGLKVLDIAAGRGTSAFHVAQTFACEVVGVDLSQENIKFASEEAVRLKVSDRVKFQLADAEKLPFDDQCFDAILCECAFCTFPDKSSAAREFFRVLMPGGRLGLSDLTRAPEALPELDGLLSWISCIGDARPVESYVETLKAAGLNVEDIEDHSESLLEMVRQVQGKLLAADIMVGLKKLPFVNEDLSTAKHFARAAAHAAREGKLGYVAIGAFRSY